MNRLTNTYVSLMLLSALIAAAEVRADQNDPRLAGYFASLRHAQSDDSALVAERAITALWHIGPQPAHTTVLKQAKQLIQGWAFDEAMAMLNDLIATAPDFAEAWNQRATLSFLQRNYDASIGDVEVTLSLEPRHFAALSGLGQMRLQRGDLAGAVSAFERALAVHPRLPFLQDRVDALRAIIKARR